MSSLESGNVTFSPEAFDEILFWASEDRKILKRIKSLISDIKRNGLLNGIGEPEQLKYGTERYSRRINQEHRLVYTLKSGTLFIISCRGHYSE